MQRANLDNNTLTIYAKLLYFRYDSYILDTKNENTTYLKHRQQIAKYGLIFSIMPINSKLMPPMYHAASGLIATIKAQA